MRSMPQPNSEQGGVKGGGGGGVGGGDITPLSLLRNWNDSQGKALSFVISPGNHELWSTVYSEAPHLSH